MRDDDGTAIVEFVFVAVIVLVPLIYVIVAVADTQRSQLAVAQAARDAGRAFATSDSETEAVHRMRVAIRLAMSNQDLPDDADVRFVAASAPCTSDAIAPRLAPGAEFAVCVTRHVELPAVPTILDGHGVTTVGRYVVRIDQYRTARP